MDKQQQQEKELVAGFAKFKSQNGRTPSLRELAATLKWSKSHVDRTIERLIGRGVFTRTPGVSKSLVLVEK